MAVDAKRGKIFTKVIREITVAARMGGGDPNGNPRLRLAVLKAREQNMPQDNIKRAIQKGTGELPGQTIEELTYEGYGPGGVAIMIECMTDNRNRTLPEIRHLLTRYNGSMGEAGCVGWLFEKKGYLVVERAKADEEALMTIVLDAGAEDLRVDGDRYEIICELPAFESVKRALEQKSVPTIMAEMSMIPKNLIKLEGKGAEQMVHLLEALEDHDDVQKVWANFDIADEVMEKVAAG
jgi:YebC/PmpR family DNA-binding regulatory protein